MDKAEAERLLRRELAHYRSKPYEELAALIDALRHYQITGKGDITYQIEVQAFWDNPRKRQGDIRVIASIDDGGLLSSFKPLSMDFIISPSGDFVGE